MLFRSVSQSRYAALEFDTKIPSLNDQANIVEAFKLYHYGLDNYDGSTPPASDSIESHLSGIDGRITDLENTPSGGGLVQNNIPHLLTKADSSLTTLPEGYIWVDGDGSVASITEAGTVTYTNNEPSEPTHGMVWIDKDYTVAPVNISNYLSSADASSTYLTQTYASTTYAPKASPTFTGTAIIPTATITTVNATDISSTGLLSIQEATETVVNGSISSGSLTANFNDGNIFYISASPTANSTINATNVSTTNDRIITMSFIVIILS